MKKISILLFLICVLLNKSLGQNTPQYFIPKIDMSGFDRSRYQEILNTAAIQLVQAFPQEYRDSIKVYDYGFYLHNEKMEMGLPSVFADMVNEAKKESPYSLIFGKQTDQSGVYSKFWISLNLPNKGKFSCMDKLSVNVRKDLESKLEILANTIHEKNDKTTYLYSIAERAVIDTLKSFIIKTVGCCEAFKSGGERGGIACSGCILSSEDMIIKQKKLNFIFDPVRITKDDDYIPSFNKDGRDRGVLKVNAEVQVSMDLKPIEVDELIRLHAESQKEWIHAGTMSIHYFKYPRDCDKFETEWNKYLNDDADVTFFVSLININNSYGILGFNYRESDNFKQGHKGGDCTNCIRKDELNEVEESREEVSENGKIACSELINLTLEELGNSFSYHYRYAKEYARPVTAEETRAYQAAQRDINARLKPVKEEFYTYYKKEYAFVKLEYDKLWNNSTLKVDYIFSRPKSWVVTENICGEHIHSMLDYCGLVEGPGIVCDLANSALYLVEGQGGTAALAALSVVPFLSEAIPAYKYSGRIWNSVKATGSCLSGNKGGSSSVCKLCKLSWKKGNLYWGRQSRLRELFKYIGDIPIGKEAHHVFPYELASSKLSEKAKKLLEKLHGKGWHVNDPHINGVLLEGTTKCGKKYHTKNTGHYDEIFKEMMKRLEKTEDLDKISKKVDKVTAEVKRILLEGEQKALKETDPSKFKNMNEYIQEQIPSFETFLDNLQI